jgi:hypothetical protein
VTAAGAAAITVALAAGAAWYVLAPLVRAVGNAAAAREAGSPDEYARLVREREAALRVLRDLALDHATGKMSDADYDALRRRQEAVALDVLRRLDASGRR